MPPRRPATRDADPAATAAKVAFLADPASYPDRPARIEVVETHHSWVFLAGDRVLKLKKPTRGELFDFTTPEARRRNAEAELRLNRRLAPETYLGVVPLALSSNGRLAFGSEGRIVDWLVEMRRLPVEDMLDSRLAERRWHPTEIRRLGDRLADFYARACPVPMSALAFFARVSRECEASVEAFARTGQRDLEARAAPIALRLRGFLSSRRPLFLHRLRAGRFVEGHGDLRPEHVALRADVELIDCLEFSRTLRLVDPVDELAFLGLECARLGAPRLEPILFARYRRRTGDDAAPELVAFYGAYRALIRARLAIDHLEDEGMANAAKWRGRASAYLALAGARLPCLARRHASASALLTAAPSTAGDSGFCRSRPSPALKSPSGSLSP